jgi:hypothetical protein
MPRQAAERWHPAGRSSFHYPRLCSHFKPMSTQPGFAIRRNGTCISGHETDCGVTEPPFRGCCPLGFECPTQYNIACCPSGQNCTESLLSAPEQKCANSTWDLYDNGGYFCCEHGLEGFNETTTFSNVCAEPEASLSGVVPLPIISTGQCIDFQGLN